VQFSCGICGVKGREVLDRSNVGLSRYGFSTAPEKENPNCEHLKIKIMFCEHCLHGWNALFDINNVNYESNNIIEAGIFSEEYIKYQVKQATFLNNTLELEKACICEIGAGAGIFLEHLTSKMKIAYEPSDERLRISGCDKVFGQYFNENSENFDCELVVCRQVLEHVQNPMTFIENIKNKNLAESHHLYLEVPNGQKSFSESRYFDFYYEHNSYFSTNSLSYLLKNVGYTIKNLSLGKNNEIIEVLASFEDRNHGIEVLSNYTQQINKIKNEISEYQNVMVWGAAGNGSSFINAVKEHSVINYVIDSDVNKQGLYIPNSTVRIISPSTAKTIRPDAIIIASQFHKFEIQNQIEAEFKSCKIILL
tara:strand:- start:1181 stop:2275 length:1095 start_codon:yes stop_codon:yes gene_type:complete